MNHKGLLQEWCQASGKALPRYTTTRCGGTDNLPKFMSTVTVDKTTYKGSPRSSKKAAETCVACKAFEKVSGKAKEETIPDEKIVYVPPKPRSLSKGEYSYIAELKSLMKNPNVRPSDVRSSKKKLPKEEIFELVFVDLENASTSVKDFKSLPSHVFRGKKFFGFLSEFSPILPKYKDLKNTIEVKTVRSSIKDAADVLMTVYVAMLLGAYPDTSIAIVTRDHYGAALLDVISEIEPGRKIRHIATLENL